MEDFKGGGESVSATAVHMLLRRRKDLYWVLMGRMGSVRGLVYLRNVATCLWGGLIAERKTYPVCPHRPSSDRE